MQIDLNVDMGESFGMYSLGDDEGFMPFITSANVACGFHAGDPVVMKRTVALAKKHGVKVGAHPGFPDLQGFGRRVMEVTMEELYCDLVYQIGALKGFLGACGMKLHHVKPHGKLYGMAHGKEEVASTVCEAIRDTENDAYLYCMKRGILANVAEKYGIRPVFEMYSDLDYDMEGNLAITRHHDARRPGEVASRVIGMVRGGKVKTNAGTEIDIEGSSVCVHSDSPGALDIVRAVREAIEDAGFTIVAP